MSQDKSHRLSRRSFLQGTSVLGGSALLAGSGSAVAAPNKSELPQRVLGRTNEKVSALTLGTWPTGKCEAIDKSAVARVVNEAIDLGINFIDTAAAYGNAEEGIGEVMRTRRDEVLLTTKVWADTADEARSSFEQSLRFLKTDSVDVLYIHSMGNRDMDKLLGDDGALSYLLKQKERGRTRFLGISGHSMCENFNTAIRTDKIDVVLMAMNFVDRHTYGFEEKVLPVAREHNVGVCCMKVFGGLKGGFGVATGPNPGPEMPTDYLQQAIRYAMGLEGVATLVIGPHTVEQLRQNVEFVKNYVPLSAEEQASLVALGKKLAPQWGPHYGPVA